MGLETSTYIGGLTATWPPSGDPKSQGDDHIRLLKTTLQSTFPNATKPFRLPTSNVLSANTTLTLAHDNGFLVCVTGTPFTITLPTLTSVEAGWSVRVMKAGSDGGYVHVVPAGGTIGSQVGSTALIRVGQVCQPATFLWDGGGWYCWKPGGLIGETIAFDGGVPPGWLEPFGQAFDGVSFCELAAALGTTTLRNKAGRLEAGHDPGYGVLTSNTIAGGGHIMGAIGGAELITLALTQIPAHGHHMDFTSGNDSPDHAHGYDKAGSDGNFQKTGGAGTSPYYQTTGVNTGGATARHAHNIAGDTWNAGGSSWHSNQPPTIVVRKLIRAC